MEREQIKKGLEQLRKHGLSNGGTLGYHAGWCDEVADQLENALALINSQEQKIFELENRLKECENGYEGTLALERAKVKKLTEENDRLRMSEHTEQRTETKQTPIVANNTGYIDKQALLDEFEQWNFGKHGQLEKHFADRVIDIIDKVPTADVAPIFDTVRKMQAEIKKYYSKPQYQPTKEHPTKHTQIKHLFAVIDQTAKELLEGV